MKHNLFYADKVYEDDLLDLERVAACYGYSTEVRDDGYIYVLDLQDNTVNALEIIEEFELEVGG